MTLSLRLDLDGASLAQLHSFLAAAEVTGCSASTRVRVEGTSLVAEVDAATLADASAAGASATSSAQTSAATGTGSPAHTGPAGPLGSRPLAGPVGETAIRSVIDILTGKMNPPTV